jgi:hypothetical protein
MKYLFLTIFSFASFIALNAQAQVANSTTPSYKGMSKAQLPSAMAGDRISMMREALASSDGMKADEIQDWYLLTLNRSISNPQSTKTISADNTGNSWTQVSSQERLSAKNELVSKLSSFRFKDLDPLQAEKEFGYLQSVSEILKAEYELSK